MNDYCIFVVVEIPLILPVFILLANIHDLYVFSIFIKQTSMRIYVTLTLGICKCIFFVNVF